MYCRRVGTYTSLGQAISSKQNNKKQQRNGKLKWLIDTQPIIIYNND